MVKSFGKFLFFYIFIFFQLIHSECTPESCINRCCIDNECIDDILKCKLDINDEFLPLITTLILIAIFAIGKQKTKSKQKNLLIVFFYITLLYKIMRYTLNRCCNYFIFIGFVHNKKISVLPLLFI